MFSISGLIINNNGHENIIDIHPECVFKKSSIEINGKNCNIKIDKCTKIDGLNLRVIGNNKIIHIGSSSKKIRNLKITSIRGDNQKLIIGDSFGCGGTDIQMNDGDEDCIIGYDCLFSWNIKIRTSDGHSVVDLTTKRAINLPRDVFIGDHVWVGEDVKILKGATVQNDSVIGSSSIVTKPFDESNIILAGIPASIVKRNITWDRKMPREYNLDNLISD